MSDIYKLEDLDGITVGAGQDFDSIADLSEYLVDRNGNYDESEAREICMNALGGEDIDEGHPEYDWGDHKWAVSAGK